MTTEALLQARNVLQTEHDLLSGLLRTYQGDLVVNDCGTDPVSPHASTGFNEKIGLIVRQATAYVQSLQDATDQLDHTLHGYETTDEQIKTSFEAYKQSHPASTQSPDTVRPTSPFDPAASLRQYTPSRQPGDLSPLANHTAPGPAGGPR